jgi:hypothetical protein
MRQNPAGQPLSASKLEGVNVLIDFAMDPEVFVLTAKIAKVAQSAQRTSPFASSAAFLSVLCG